MIFPPSKGLIVLGPIVITNSPVITISLIPLSVMPRLIVVAVSPSHRPVVARPVIVMMPSKRPMMSVVLVILLPAPRPVPVLGLNRRRQKKRRQHP